MEKTTSNLGLLGLVLSIIFLAVGMSGYGFFETMLTGIGILGIIFSLVLLFLGLVTKTGQEHFKEALEHPKIAPCKFCGAQFTIPSREYEMHLQTEHPKELKVDELYTLAVKMLIHYGEQMQRVGATTLFAPEPGFQDATRLAVEKTQMWQNIEGLLQQAYSIHPEYTKKRIEEAIAIFQRNRLLEVVAQLTRILSSLKIEKPCTEKEVSAKSEIPYYAPSESFYQTSYQFKIDSWKEEKPKEESKAKKRTNK
jgi:hypothetical protein